MFVGLLTSLVNGSNHTKYVSLTNEKCISQPTIINYHPNEYTHWLHYYPFPVNLDRCVDSCNTLKELSNKKFIPNKTENLNLNLFNMITRANLSKTLTKHVCILCKFDINVNLMAESVIQIKSEHHKHNNHICETDYIWNPATCSCKTGKYLAIVIGNSVTMSDEVMDGESKSYNEETKPVTSFNANKEKM